MLMLKFLLKYNLRVISFITLSDAVPITLVGPEQFFFAFKWPYFVHEFLNPIFFVWYDF